MTSTAVDLTTVSSDNRRLSSGDELTHSIVALVGDDHRNHRGHVHNLNLDAIDQMEDQHVCRENAVEMTQFSMEICSQRLLFNNVEKMMIQQQSRCQSVAVTANDESEVELEQFVSLTMKVSSDVADKLDH